MIGTSSSPAGIRRDRPAVVYQQQKEIAVEIWDVTTREHAQAAVIPLGIDDGDLIGCQDLYDWMGVTAAAPAGTDDDAAVNDAATARRFTPEAAARLRLAGVWLDPRDFAGVVAPDHPAARSQGTDFIRRAETAETAGELRP